MLKIWADRYHCTAEIKGGHVNLRHKRFIVTSNYIPEQIWTDDALIQAIRRRFHFYNIEKPAENIPNIPDKMALDSEDEGDISKPEENKEGQLDIAEPDDFIKSIPGFAEYLAE